MNPQITCVQIGQTFWILCLSYWGTVTPMLLQVPAEGMTFVAGHVLSWIRGKPHTKSNWHKRVMAISPQNTIPLFSIPDRDS